MQMSVDRTLNPVTHFIGKNSRKCFGCNLNPINRFCVYRWWKEEGRQGYAFRVFRKVHLLPSCRRANFEYPERDEFKKKYCETLGCTPAELGLGSGPGSGKGGGRPKKKRRMLIA